MLFPFFELVALGGILAVLFYPLKKSLAKYIKSDTIVTILTVISAVLIILIPVYLIGQLVFNEIAGLYSQAKSGGFNFNQNELLSHLSGTSRALAENFIYTAGQKISDFAGNAFASISNILTNIAGFVVGFILVIFTLYYFLKDGNHFREFIERVFPLSHTHEMVLVEKMEMAIKGVVQGNFTVALLQGTVSTIGFFIFGVPNPLLWGLFTVMSSLVPTVGTLLSLVPAIIYLFITSHTGAGIGMTIWAFISIQSIDNFISPRVIGHRVNLHPLITLLSVLGGIAMFGYIGFLLGPIIMAMFLALVDIYSADKI